MKDDRNVGNIQRANQDPWVSSLERYQDACRELDEANKKFKFWATLSFWATIWGIIGQGAIGVIGVLSHPVFIPLVVEGFGFALVCLALFP